MSRKRIDYTEQELSRQAKYIIVIGGEAGAGVALAKSIEESKLVLEKYIQQKAVIFTRDHTNELTSNLKTIAPTMVQTFNPNQVRLISANIDTDNDYVIKMASKGLKNGLFIIDKDLLSAKSSKELLEVEGKGQDYIIHRSKLGFLKPELEYIRTQLQKANLALEKNEGYIPPKRIILRIHADSSFGFGKEQMLQLFDTVGQEHGFNLYLANYIAYRRARNVKTYCRNVCANNGELFEDYINPEEYKNQIDQFAYYDWFMKKILVHEEEVQTAIEEVAYMLQKN